MIAGEHALIRTAEPDDAPALKRLYDPDNPRASLLDTKREMLVPTEDELRVVLSGGPDSPVRTFNAIEYPSGAIAGFCALRPSPKESYYGQLTVLLHDEDEYRSPIAEHVLAHLLREAFEGKQFNKVMAPCLDHEASFRALLLAHDFVSDGVQREILYSAGRWFSMESFTLFDSTWTARANDEE